MAQLPITVNSPEEDLSTVCMYVQSEEVWKVYYYTKLW